MALLHVKVEGPGGELTNPSVFVIHLRDGQLTEFWAMNDRQGEFDRVVDG